MDIGEDYSHFNARKYRRQKIKINTDSVSAIKIETPQTSFENVRLAAGRNLQENTNAVLLCGERTSFFFTEDSRRYITGEQERQNLIRNHYVDAVRMFDSVHVRYRREQTVGERQYAIARVRIHNTYALFAAYRQSVQAACHVEVSPVRMWQLSLTGAMIFGMVSMSLIYQNLGQSAFAKDAAVQIVAAADEKDVVKVIENVDDDSEEAKELVEKKEKEKEEEKKVVKVIENVEDEAVSGEEVEVAAEVLDESKEEEKSDVEKETAPVIVADIVEKSSEENAVDEQSSPSLEVADEQGKKLVSVDSAQKKETVEENTEKSLEELAGEEVEGYPIEKMLPYILEQDPEVAKYLIAIAKQESAWGKRVPVLNGQDCYNYWGFRAKRKLMGSGGHTCFNSRKDAVETVGRRIHELIYEYDRKSAERLIVWKCGSTCAGHSQAGVDRWIGVVDMYYQRLSMK